jgi:hypothetical protein
MSETVLLIPQDDDNLHQLEVVRRSPDHIELHTNNRTLGLSPRMAEEMIVALQAVKSGEYQRAITQTSERMTRELARKPAPRDYTDRATSPRAIPTLEDI